MNFFDYVSENLIVTMVNTSRDARELPKLDYKKEHEDEPGKIYLVVGGNILSRGLTLEGLTVSYFLRTSSMYDTLLQMGRWFGFRNEYSDLPRIWTTEGIKKNFYHLAQVEQEIREEMSMYNNWGVNPLNYKIRIRIIPKMQVTSRLKMKDAETNKRYSLNTQRSEITVFDPKNLEILNHNIKTVKSLFEKNSSKLMSYKHQYIISGVKNSDIREFLDSENNNRFIINKGEPSINPVTLIKYLDELTKENLLSDWNIVFDSLNSESKKLGKLKISNDLILNCRKRSELLDKSNYIYFKHITSERDYFADIEKEVLQSIKDQSIIKKLEVFNIANKSNLKLKNQNKINNEDKVIYRLLFAQKTGMIFIVPISKDSDSVDAVQHLISFMIVLPPLNPRKDSSNATTQPLLRSNYISGIPDEEYGELEEEVENDFEEETEDNDE